MKKLFVGVLAIASMVACMNEETVRVKDGNPIAFENTYVQNATRSNDPSTTTNNIQEFSVWAYMDAVGGVVFDDELVSRNGDAWTYNQIQYWMPGHNYYFAAFAGDRSAIETLPATMEANGLGVVKFTNVDGTNDILYSEAVVADAAADQAPVALTFKHLLSKVKFTFKNGFQNDNNFVVVKNITMDVAETAYVDLSADADFANRESVLPWTNLDGTKTLEFGDVNKLNIGVSEAAENERLTIPATADYEYVINFDVEVYNGSVLGLQKSMEVKLTGLELVAGRAYNLMATINQENLNLNKIEFTATVEEWIPQDIDGGAVEGEVSFVTSAAQIQEILDKATEDVTILFGADITDGDVNILQKEGIDVTINGNGKKFTGVFNVNGDARAAGKETLTFTGINFEANEKKTFISAPSKVNGRYNYSHNITIEGCTFTGAYDQGVEVAAASFTGAFNIVMKSCEAYKMHSLLQTQSVDNTVLVENVKVVASKNGVSFGNAAFPTLRNAEIEAEFYGVRADGDAKRGNLVIENAKINANQPVVVRKVTSNGYKVNVDEASELNTAELYQVIFTKGSDDAAYVAPEVEFTYNVPSCYNVFPLAEGAAVNVSNDAQLREQLKAGNDVVLTEDITTTDADSNGYGATGININGGVFDGNGHTIEVEGATSTWDSAIAIKGGTIKNVTVAKGFRGIFFKNGTEKIVLENVIINGPTYTISCDSAGKQGFEAYNSKFYGWTSYAGTIGTGYFEGCTFGKGAGYNFSRPYAPTTYVNCDFEAGHAIDARAAVTFENCRFNGVALTADNIATLVTGNVQNVVEVK